MAQSHVAARRLAWSREERIFALLVLCFASSVNLVDRMLITILIEPIKREFSKRSLSSVVGAPRHTPPALDIDERLHPRRLLLLLHERIHPRGSGGGRAMRDASKVHGCIR
jgi:hypothetical protein